MLNLAGALRKNRRSWTHPSVKTNMLQLMQVELSAFATRNTKWKQIYHQTCLSGWLWWDEASPLTRRTCWTTWSMTGGSKRCLTVGLRVSRTDIPKSACSRSSMQTESCLSNLQKGADLASRPQPQADHWMQFLGPPWSTLMFCTCCSRCQIALARQSRGLVMPVTTGLRLRSLDPRIRAKESQRVRAVDHLPSKCRLDLKAGHLETATTSPYVSTITFLMAANCPWPKAAAGKVCTFAAWKNCFQSNHTFQTCPNKRSSWLGECNVSPNNTCAGDSIRDAAGAATVEDPGLPAIEGVEAGTTKRGAPLIMEICAGTAILSKCFEDCGFEHLAIDHKSNRFHSYVTVCNVELSTEHGWAFLYHIIEHYNVVFVHAAPPCGHAAVPEKSRLVLVGDQSSCVVKITHRDCHIWKAEILSRVQLANSLYSGLTKFLTKCTLQDIPWSVENPTSSYLWLIPCLLIWLLKRHAGFTIMTRKLQRSFLSTLPAMCGIQARCPGDHEHAPFGRTRQSDGTFKYATSDEAAYTKQLCVQVVSIVQNALQLFPQKFEADPSNVAVNHKGMIAMQKQPAGRRMPPWFPNLSDLKQL